VVAVERERARRMGAGGRREPGANASFGDIASFFFFWGGGAASYQQLF